MELAGGGAANAGVMPNGPREPGQRDRGASEEGERHVPHPEQLRPGEEEQASTLERACHRALTCH